MNRRLFCAIPARGGSERFPRKNVALLGGQPLIAHSIAAARDAGCFDAVYVCTEDPEIAEIARQCGALVPTLIPQELAGPLVPSHQPCQWLHERLAIGAEALVCLQPTSPLRSADDIRAGVKRLSDGKVSFVVSVTAIDPHYFHWALAKRGGMWRPYFGTRFMKERPLLPPVFRPNGSIKIARFDALKRIGHFFGSPLEVIETPEERSIHVAIPADLAVCEGLFERRVIR